MTGKSRENKNLQTSQKEWKLLIVNNFHYYPTLFHVGMRRQHIFRLQFIKFVILLCNSLKYRKSIN